MNQNKICFTRWTTLLHNYLRLRKPYPKQPISVISKLKLNIFSLRKWRSLYSNLYQVRLQLDWTRLIVIFFEILAYGSRKRWRTHQCQPWDNIMPHQFPSLHSSLSNETRRVRLTCYPPGEITITIIYIAWRLFNSLNIFWNVWKPYLHCCIDLLIVGYWWHMATKIWDNISHGCGSLPYGTKQIVSDTIHWNIDRNSIIYVREYQLVNA